MEWAKQELADLGTAGALCRIANNVPMPPGFPHRKLGNATRKEENP